MLLISLVVRILSHCRGRRFVTGRTDNRPDEDKKFPLPVSVKIILILSRRDGRSRSFSLTKTINSDFFSLSVLYLFPSQCCIVSSASVSEDLIVEFRFLFSLLPFSNGVEALGCTELLKETSEICSAEHPSEWDRFNDNEYCFLFEASDQVFT